MKLLAETEERPGEQGAPAMPLAQLSTCHPMTVTTEARPQVLGD